MSSTTFQVARTIRNLGRYQQIISVLVRYGFSDIIQETGVDRFIERGVRLFTRARSDEHHDTLTRPERVRKAMEELGPTFIKLGQILSTRPDLIPQEWADEFRNLQDDCPQIEFDIIRARLDEEFPGKVDELFSAINPEPLAAASMAQVHHATLTGGPEIVLKILRPDIEATVESDIEILQTLAELAEAYFSNLGINPTEVVAEFAREIRKELDFTLEGTSTDRLRNYFIGDDGVSFPKVYWEATSKRVLALERIDGVLLSRLEDDSLSPDDRRAVVANGARAVMRMCLEIGFFHADPHPGNIFAMPGGAVCFIDCGMTGRLDPRTAQQLASLVQGVVSQDLDNIVEAVLALGDVDVATVDERTVRADIQEIAARFIDVPIERLNIGEALNLFFEALRRHHVRCPADLVLLIKALATIENVAEELDPSFDMVACARPYVEKLIRSRYSMWTIRKRIQRSFVKYADLVESLPGEIGGLIGQVRRNRLTMNLEHKGMERMTHTIEHASRNIAYCLIIAALVVASSILVLASTRSEIWGLGTLGMLGFASAAVTAMLLVVSNFRAGNRG